MIKTSFTVGYNLNRVHHVVFGVTSIVPNLNGVLMFTEDGENHFIESCDLKYGVLPNMHIEYSTEEDISNEFEIAAEKPNGNKIHDHRKK